MKFLSTQALSTTHRAKWVAAVERLYLPVLRDPGSSDTAKERAKKKLEAARSSG